jgi:TonB family protein
VCLAPGLGATAGVARDFWSARSTYTAAALNALIEGSVDVELIVQSNGTVSDVRVTRSLDHELGLDEEAIKAAKRWLYRPGQLSGGAAVPVRVDVNAQTERLGRAM